MIFIIKAFLIVSKIIYYKMLGVLYKKEVNMKKVISGGIFGLLGLAFPIYSHAITLEGSIGAVELSPSGYINYHSSGVSDNVDIKNDLGFSSKVEPNLRLKINTDEIPILPNFEFSYLPVKFSGYTTNQNIVYDGYTFNGNLSSSLKADHYDIYLHIIILLL